MITHLDLENVVRTPPALCVREGNFVFGKDRFHNSIHVDLKPGKRRIAVSFGLWPLDGDVGEVLCSQWYDWCIDRCAGLHTQLTGFVQHAVVGREGRQANEVREAGETVGQHARTLLAVQALHTFSGLCSVAPVKRNSLGFFRLVNATILRFESFSLIFSFSFLRRPLASFLAFVVLFQNFSLMRFRSSLSSFTFYYFFS